LVLLAGLTANPLVLLPLPAVMVANMLVSRRLLTAFYRGRGIGFAAAATLYYLALYPLAVGVGSFAGTLRHFSGRQAFGGLR